MAWIVQPSATTRIATRPEPYLTAELRAQFERELLPRYEERRGALLPILHVIQHAHHCIPHQAMKEIAEFLGIAPADVLDTMSFYEEFSIEPRGRYVIGICQSIACEVCGHQAILDAVRDKLDIEPHETTEDGRFTLLAMECLGACEGAPCALINEDRHDNLSIDSLLKMIDELP